MRKQLLFKALDFVIPGWYYNLLGKSELPYFVDYRSLPNDVKKLINYDGGYSTEDACLRDAAYQAWNKGLMFQNLESVSRIDVSRAVDAQDEYRFLRKYFNPLWSIYFLIVRLFSFHNPFREVKGILRNWKQNRITVNSQHRSYDEELSSFNSNLVRSQPFVSVVIPTLNRYLYLKDVLKDLEKQTYQQFEVIVVDQSVPFDSDFYKGFNLRLNLIRQEERALWLARNTAIKVSNGEWILLFDDDSRVEPDWIEKHLKCVDYFQVDISSGVSISTVGAKVPKNYSFYRWGDQVDTGNVLVKKDIFRAIGLFDRQFEGQRMGDGEFGLRAYLAGYTNVSNPEAKRLHLKVGEGGLREMGSWDGYRPKKWWKPRPIPSVLYLYRKYFGNRTAIKTLLVNIPPSLIPYKFKSNRLLALTGFMMTLIIFPLILFQVFSSWRLSGKKLRQGPYVEYLR